MSKALTFDFGRGFARLNNLRALLNDVGERAVGIMRVEEDVVDGDTVTIGTDVFEVDIIDTDTAQEVEQVGGMTDDQTFILADVGVWAIPVLVGDILEVETEWLLVTAIQNIGAAAENARFTVIRGWAGTTAATHVDTTTINQSNARPVDRISVPTNAAGLTAALFTDALAAIINDGAISAVDGVTNPARFIQSDQAGLVTALGRNDNDLVIAARAIGVLALATTETFNGATNVFDAVALAGGADPVSRQIVALTRVPTAAEVTAAEMIFPVDFTPVFVHVQVKVTATGIQKETAAANATQLWGGATTVIAGSGDFPDAILLENGGTIDWATTDTIHILAIG